MGFSVAEATRMSEENQSFENGFSSGLQRDLVLSFRTMARSGIKTKKQDHVTPSTYRTAAALQFQTWSANPTCRPAERPFYFDSTYEKRRDFVCFYLSFTFIVKNGIVLLFIYCLGYCGRKTHLSNSFILAQHKPRVMSSRFEASNLVWRLSLY